LDYICIIPIALSRVSPVGTSPAPNAAGHSTAQESRQRQEGTGRQGGTQAKDLPGIEHQKT